MPAKPARPAAKTAKRSGVADPRDSLVLQVPAAEPVEAEHHFLTQLSFETDPSDVHTDLGRGVNGFVLVDCRSGADYAKGHVPTAVSMPYRDIGHESTARLGRDATYVVYDSGLLDNAATKTCLRLAALGFRVKEMMGGLHGWRAEGFPVAVGTAAGKLAAASRTA
jgi:rhodanese-related sulfurtransferase